MASMYILLIALTILVGLLFVMVLVSQAAEWPYASRTVNVVMVVMDLATILIFCFALRAAIEFISTVTK